MPQLMGPTPHSSTFSRKNDGGNEGSHHVTLQITITDVISFGPSPSEISWANITMPISRMSRLGL